MYTTTYNDEYGPKATKRRRRTVGKANRAAVPSTDGEVVAAVGSLTATTQNLPDDAQVDFIYVWDGAAGDAPQDAGAVADQPCGPSDDPMAVAWQRAGADQVAATWQRMEAELDEFKAFFVDKITMDKDMDAWSTGLGAFMQRWRGATDAEKMSILHGDLPAPTRGLAGPASCSRRRKVGAQRCPA